MTDPKCSAILISNAQRILKTPINNKICIHKMSSAHNTNTKPVFDDLMDMLPVIKDCASDGNKCACTDPSYQYPNTCSIKPVSSTDADHSGRVRCTYGKTGSGYENSTTSGAANNGDFTFSVGTTTGKQQYTPDTNTSSYPRGILFCSDPNASSLPTTSKSNITVVDGTPSNWDIANTGTGTQPNLGFD